jgi:hypothetical protein
MNYRSDSASGAIPTRLLEIEIESHAGPTEKNGHRLLVAAMNLGVYDAQTLQLIKYARLKIGQSRR